MGSKQRIRRNRPLAGGAVYEALGDTFGPEAFEPDQIPRPSRDDKEDERQSEEGEPDFPVRMRDGTSGSCRAISDVLQHIPPAVIDYVYADRAVYEDAKEWLQRNRDNIIRQSTEEETDGSD